MPLSPSLARSFFLLSLIYELRDSSACSFFCKSKTAGSAGREKCWSLSLSLSPSLARDFDGRTQNEEARARSEKEKKTRAETKNFKEPRMDKREKAKALDAKAKKKSASSAASKDEKKKDKVRGEWEKRWKGGADRCEWFQRWRRRLDSDSESALRESRRLCCILRCFVWMCRPCAVTLSVCVAQKKRRDSAETDRRREREA